MSAWTDEQLALQDADRASSYAGRSSRTCRSGRTPASPAVAAPGRREGRAARCLLPRGGRRPGRVAARLGGDAGGVLRGRRLLRPGRRRCSPAGSRCRTWRRTGRREQIDAFVRPTLAGEKIGSLAVTEPGGGSDVAGIRTTAVRDGDSYVVNGAKTFITSGVRADFVTTAVRTGGPGHAGVSLLVVEKGTPGFTVDRGLAKMGWHCSDTAELSFVDVRVPAANLVGEENCGFYLIAEQFVVERIALAVHAYGIAARSLALTAAYCRERETFGKPLIARQVVQHKLVEMHRQVEAARIYTPRCRRAARRRRERHRRGLPGEADRGRGVRPRRRPGRAAARRHRLHARDRGGAALPRRPDPGHRRRSDRSAHRPVRPTAGLHAMTATVETSHESDRRAAVTSRLDASRCSPRSPTSRRSTRSRWPAAARSTSNATTPAAS